MASIKSKLLFFTFIVIFVTLAVNIAVNSLLFSEDYSLALESEATAIGYGLKIQMEKLLNLGLALEDITGFEVQCMEIVNGYELISYAFVLDTSGRILFHNDPTQHGRIIEDTALLAAVKERKQTRLGPNEEDYFDVVLPFYNKNNEYLGSIILGFPQAIIYNKLLKSILFSVSISSIIFILGLILLTLGTTLGISRPLGKLVFAMQAIGEKGDLNKKIVVRSRDEIGKLASAFNLMLEDLKKSNKKLKFYSNNLEKMVKQRTKELASKNEDLEKFKNLAVNRELKMIELKKKLEDKYSR